MAEETKNTAPVQEEPKQPQGWADVQITPDMPLSALVGFFNVLNQRLASIENLITVPVDGKSMTLTDLYAKQAKEEMEKQAAGQSENKGE